MGVKLGLMLREKLMLMVFKNRVLGRLFGRKRDEVKREWRKLHIEELPDLYSIPNIIREIIVRWISMKWKVGAWTGLM
jgi:hypothetical protein